jgi:hypothetical protein
MIGLLHMAHPARLQVRRLYPYPFMIPSRIAEHHTARSHSPGKISYLIDINQGKDLNPSYKEGTI